MLLGLVLIVSSLMTYFQFIRPAYDESQIIKSQQLGHSLFLQNEQEAIKKVQDLISAYQTQSRIQDAVSLSLPTEEDIGGALAQIYGIAKNSGLTFQSASISLLGIQAAGGDIATQGSGQGAAVAPQFSLQQPVGSVVFSVRLTGSYEGLKDFLGLLETNIRIFDVGVLSIGSAATSGGVPTGIFNYDLSITTYYQVKK